MTPRPTRSRRLRAVTALTAIAAVATAGGAAYGQGYAVRPGDTLSAIASRLHVSMGALARANHLPDPDRVLAGQVLVVPGAPPPRLQPLDPIVPGPLAPVETPPRGAPQYPAELLAHPARLALVPYFRYWARAYAVPAGLVEAVAWQESGWQTGARSRTGAIGVGQIEPSTATFISHDVLHLRTGLDARLADANIRMSAAYVAWLLWATKGDIARSLGGYYEGLSTLRDKGIYNSTRRYVVDVGALWAAFRSG